MTMNNQGRPTAPGTVEGSDLPTISGDRGLQHEVSLIFELGRPGMTGVDIPQVQMSDARLGGLRRRGPVGLPGLSEPEVIRHYVRLSQLNYSIDAGLYPLGSCTMKHNPRTNEEVARLPGFAASHPLAPEEVCQGTLELAWRLENIKSNITRGQSADSQEQAQELERKQEQARDAAQDQLGNQGVASLLGVSSVKPGEAGFALDAVQNREQESEGLQMGEEARALGLAKARSAFPPATQQAAA